MNQRTTIVNRHDLDALWERLLYLLKFLLYPINDLESVLAVAHYDDASHDSSPKIRAEMNIPYLF